MGPMGRGGVIMKVLEARKTMPPAGFEKEPEAGGGEGFSGMARGHCQKGLAMAREYLEGEEGQSSSMRPKVEALAAAYEDLLSTLEDGGSEEED